MDSGETLTLIDVREPYEWDIARIPGARLILLGEIEARSNELDPDTEILLQCRSGKRSADALNRLKAKGFSKFSISHRSSSKTGEFWAMIDSAAHVCSSVNLIDRYVTYE